MKTILFVSHYALNRDIFPEMLEMRLPVSVVTAANSESAMRELSEAPLDCIVCDDVVEGADVFDFIKTVRAKFEVPILLMWGYPGDESRRAKEAGATACVPMGALDEFWASLTKLLRLDNGFGDEQRSQRPPPNDLQGS